VVLGASNMSVAAALCVSSKRASVSFFI
jgi:hypothetical protein